MIKISDLFNKKEYLNKDELAEMLKTNPEALVEFEQMYESIALTQGDDDFFKTNSRQASVKHKADRADSESIEYDETMLNYYINRIVDELAVVSGVDQEKVLLKFIKRSELLEIPEAIRPELTGRLIKKDIKQDSYIAILDSYKRWKDTGDIKFYHMFRQGLDILDLDPIIYKILGMNLNNMGYWLPKITKATEITQFFKIPETKVIKVPLPILQLTRLEYRNLTPTTLKIVNDYCMKAFDLDVNKKYFIKTGTFSSKFDFRNAIVYGENEVKELGEYLLYIHHQALQMASPLTTPTIYGVSTTNEWVVREYIEDVEDNPTIYMGMPLHTEYRVFVDFDTNEILGVSPYWREDVMKKSFTSGQSTVHKKHDYVIYKLHEETLYKRYNKNKDLVVEEVKRLLKHTELTGQWSVDVMQNGEDFYLIDMALATQSALVDCVDPSKLNKIEEVWLPQLG